jgi:hypothetical protein
LFVCLFVVTDTFLQFYGPTFHEVFVVVSCTLYIYEV